MKEAFEKIMERLEAKKEYHRIRWNKYQSDEDSYYAHEAYSEAIEIVNQVAEEYAATPTPSHPIPIDTQLYIAELEKKVNNDGWISLPKVAFDRMIARMESESERDYDEEESWFINVKAAARIMREIAEEYDKPKLTPEQREACWAHSSKDCSKCGECYSNSEIPNMSNVGWIPCSEKTPLSNGFYECWYMVSACGEDREFVPITLYWEDNLWLYNPKRFSMPTQRNIIAWKPIVPYQPKEIQRDCNTCANNTEPDEIDNGCYMCCKGLEDNYQPKGE